ncbi:MAG: ABC transporter ATP-binding protein [Acidobacteria bacterium]|nr:ABC transporter ATP-binding protein [Acidobacteriota bacterium]
MSDIAIRVEDLGKLYHLGALQGNYRTLRETLMSSFAGPIRRMCSRFGHSTARSSTKSETQSGKDFIWALKNVSFEVRHGEVIGVIGRNGAGKSTLLKVLSHITEPTEGKVQVRGRVGSLLEVGAGFHPELTGRENVYLNGAILGMKKKEITRKFDEIVAFAEVEKFLDTPVKRYSSGMYVRLAFAVAAHMEPEVLLVDEVLAVGDTGFQRKCLGKMGNVAQEGRTVLVVSHNMAIIQKLCEKSLLLNSGKIVAYDATPNVLTKYLEELSSGSASSVVETTSSPNRLLNMKSVIKKVTLQDQNGDYKTDFNQGEPILLSVHYDARDKCEALAGSGFILESFSGVRVGGFNTYMGSQPPHRIPMKGVVHFLIQDPVLTPDHYYITVSVGPHQNRLIDKLEKIVEFDVHSLDIYGTGYLVTQEDGVVAMKCDVAVEPL